MDRATPAGLDASGRRPNSNLCTGVNDGPDCQTEIQIIRDRLFPTNGGPTGEIARRGHLHALYGSLRQCTHTSRLFADFRGRLTSIDEQIQSLSNRAAEFNRVCLQDSPTLFSPTVPGACECSSLRESKLS